jgi:hypothetical protein
MEGRFGLRRFGLNRDSIEQFKDALEPYLPDFKSLDLRVIATRQSIGYVFDAFRMVLEPFKGRVQHVDLPKSKELIAIHTKWDIRKMPDVFEILRRGEIEIDGTLIHLKRRASVDTWVPLDGIYHQRYDRNSARARFGMDSFCISLEASQNPNRDLPDQARLDNSLRCEKTPWDGMDDLKRMFARQSRIWGQDTSFLELIAPLGVKFEGKMLVEGNRLNLGIKTPVGAEPSQTSIACLVKSGRRIGRSQRILTPKTAVARSVHHAFGIQLPKKYEWVKCVLMYKGSEVDRYELHGTEGYESSSKWRIFTELTGGIGQFQTLPSGVPLEVTLEVVLHLLGFYTVHYGGRNWPVEKSTPDVIAFPRKGEWFIVLECTSRETDIRDKLGKLSTRSKELSRVTDGRKSYPVIFTALTRELVNKTDLERAAKEQISVITADDLGKLLNAIPSKKGDDEILAIIQQFVPGTL